MNAITLAQTTSMTSREIADLTGKAHAHIMRDIRSMIQRLEADPSLDWHCETETYVDGQGKEREQYRMDRDTTLTLVTGYDPVARMRIIQRWQELEHHQPQSIAIPRIELEERTVALVGQTYDLADRCHDSVLKIMLLDKCKNLLTAGNDPALPSSSAGYFQVYQVLEALGLSQSEIRHMGASAGKRVAAAYRRLTGQEPETVERVIDGAARPVKIYPASFRDDAEAVLSQYIGVEAA